MFADFRVRSLFLCATTALLLAPPALADGATITIVNIDGPNEGFNDSTAATPVGGNIGTTLGDQRLQVFQRAALIWGSIIDSAVEIKVQASFDPLSCTASSATLGGAGAIQAIANVAGLETDTWYAVALANAITETDLVPGTDPSADDIRARFNSAIDNNDDCLEGTNWYLGLDHNEGADDVDLLAVVVHELAHGLGFASFVDERNGKELGAPSLALPDIFGTHTFDISQGLFWDQMTNRERKESAINAGQVVLDGIDVVAGALGFLGAKPVMTIAPPVGIAGSYEAQPAEFGPGLPDSPGPVASVVLADDGVGKGKKSPTDACEPLINGGDIAGKIALVDRGTCNFTVKVKNAQDVFAIGVIVANNVSSGLPPMGGTDPSIMIPSVGISEADGDLVKANLPGVTAALENDTNLLAGADIAQGRPLLYTPDPVDPGSSVSHFDVTAQPDALMEPFISSSLTDSVDMTQGAFKDFGWPPVFVLPVCPNTLIEGSELCDSTNLNSESCASVGFQCVGGALSCASTCDAFDVSLCIGERSETLCDNFEDDDCDGLIDSLDPDCDTGTGSCSLLLPDGSGCTDDADCCSNKCKGRPGSKTCKAA